jgi:hypothetical protein
VIELLSQITGPKLQLCGRSSGNSRFRALDELVQKISESLSRWGYCSLDKRYTITEKLAAEHGWIVIRGNVMLDVIMPDTKHNRHIRSEFMEKEKNKYKFQ